MGKGLIDTSHSIIGGLDFAKEDGFNESRSSSELSSIVDSSSSRDDLTTSSVNSVSMKSNIHNVESNTSHVFFSHDGFFSGPLEGSFARVLNFVKILDGLSLINKKVRSRCLRSEAPDFLGIIDIPFIFVSKSSVSFLLILL